MESIASSQPDERHKRLVAASAQQNESRIRSILSEESQWHSSSDRDALRQALQRASGRGNLPIVRLLLEHGAEVDTHKENEVPALTRASDCGHAAILAALLAHKPTPEYRNLRNKSGRHPLFLACYRGYVGVARVWLELGVGVETVDKEGLTPLLYLAWEKGGRWKADVVRLLLEFGADIEERHVRNGRTPLMAAAASGNLKLAEVLLDAEQLGVKGAAGRRIADITAVTKRDQTALHLAAEYNRLEMVKLLLSRGADADAVSDGGWRPLHNACQAGHIGVVAILLQHGARINAELTNGMTSLHWAAFSGHVDVVRLLLKDRRLKLSVKDNFDRTPLLCAAEKQHHEIVQLLSPWRTADRLSAAEIAACKSFEATVTDFGNFSDKTKKHLVERVSVYDLLYGWDQREEEPIVPTQPRNVHYQPRFRWIHLPANNIAWVEALLAKVFIEAGAYDIEAFKALAKCFDQEHRGHLAHAHFMRPFAHRISSLAAEMEEAREKSLGTVSEESTDVGSGGGGSSVKTPSKPHLQLPGGGGSSGSGARTPTRSEIGDVGAGGTPKSDSKKKKTRKEEVAERHPKHQKRGSGPPGNAPGSKAAKAGAATLSRSSTMLSTDSNVRLPFSNGKLVLFMPFLHYETDERRQWMSKIISRVARGLDVPGGSRDELLVNAYLNATPPLQPRRTLDQFFYHGIDTTQRDVDQVVYRYCKRHQIQKKVFMVDQLWMWTFGRDLVVTCFPQRWDQPRRDPLNVLEGIIEDSNAKTRPPVGSIYDLAMLITGRCSGMFDRHRLDDQDYQFLDMFESSIGSVTNQESELFRLFNEASELSAQWLQKHRKRGRSQSVSETRDRSISGGDDPLFPDALLDIGRETSLLAEIKDIHDELNIIKIILESQNKILNDFETHVAEELRADGSRRATEGVVYEVRKRAREQKRLLDLHVTDIVRMDHQANNIYTSLTHLLDLKQKHSNALEARFARDQAVIAARQGQTVQIFTIVTIFFLPMSVIAAFFAIQFEEWNNEDSPLTIPYVSKYMFTIGLGISIPLILMAFKVSDIYRGARGVLADIRHLLLRKKNSGSHDGKREMKNGAHGGSNEDDHMGKPSHSLSPLEKRSLDRARDRPHTANSERPVANHVPNILTTQPTPRIPFPPSPTTSPLGRPSYETREREGRDGRRHGRPTSGLSPHSPPASLTRQRGWSIGSAWARPSLERAKGSKGSEDLERGRVREVG